MKKCLLLFFLLTTIAGIMAQTGKKDRDLNATLPFAPNPHTDAKALRHYADEKLGVIIHWGPATLRGRDSWSMSNLKEYESVYRSWNPKYFNADQWGRLIKTTGARYLVWVTKHHDGFCLWDTKTTENSVMHYPYHHDVTADFARACKTYGLDFGTYLSIIDAHDSKWNKIYPHGARMPGFPEDLGQLAKLTTDQVLELMNKYHPFLFWFDGAWLDGWRKSKFPSDVENAIRRAAPNSLITRLGNGNDDYEGIEARIGTYKPYPWETVTSVAYPQYSWSKNLRYKSVPDLVAILSRVICGNGNLLLGFFPDPDGRIPLKQDTIATELGAWTQKNAKAIYGTRGGPYYPNQWGGSTCRGKKVYLQLLAGAPVRLVLPPIDAEIKKVKIIDGGKISVKATEQSLVIEAPADQRGSQGVSIIELTLDREPRAMIERSAPGARLNEQIKGDLAPIQERGGKVPEK